jgi:hypothetical protein
MQAHHKTHIYQPAIPDAMVESYPDHFLERSFPGLVVLVVISPKSKKGT